jgi:hypothetical protein
LVRYDGRAVQRREYAVPRPLLGQQREHFGEQVVQRRLRDRACWRRSREEQWRHLDIRASADREKAGNGVPRRDVPFDDLAAADNPAAPEKLRVRPG